MKGGIELGQIVDMSFPPDHIPVLRVQFLNQGQQRWHANDASMSRVYAQLYEVPCDAVHRPVIACPSFVPGTALFARNSSVLRPCLGDPSFA